MTFVYEYHQTFLGFPTEPFFMVLALTVFIGWLWKRNGRFDVRWVYIYLLAVLGGRVWYALTHLDTLGRMLNPLVPGITSFGMIIGGALGVALLYRKEAYEMFDEISLGTALFIFIYRMGCFLFGDVPGRVTTMPWGIFAAYYHSFSGHILHPVALYLSFSGLAIFIVLHFFLGKKKRKNQWRGKRFSGELSLWFVLLYCVNRFWIDFFAFGHNWRVEPRYFGMLVGQWFCLVVAVIVAGYLWLLYKGILQPLSQRHK